ncbi:MAG: hypothetical protein FWF94_05615 [Oscillospiraceae bacterium]|nr:hypothetical protein [Oscillospiraceae bacterium]
MDLKEILKHIEQNRKNIGLSEEEMNKLWVAADDLRKFEKERTDKNLREPPEDAKYPLAWKAYYKAFAEHYEAVRETTRLPYFVHLLGVQRTLLQYKFGRNDTMLAAAILHDWIEDNVDPEKWDATLSWVVNELNKEVADLIKALTNEPTQKIDIDEKEIKLYFAKQEDGSIKLMVKADYINHKLCHMDDKALFIKLADFQDNIIESKNERESPIRIWGHIKFIEDNAEIFKDKINPDHITLMGNIKRILKDIYGID